MNNSAAVLIRGHERNRRAGDYVVRAGMGSDAVDAMCAAYDRPVLRIEHKHYRAAARTGMVYVQLFRMDAAGEWVPAVFNVLTDTDVVIYDKVDKHGRTFGRWDWEFTALRDMGRHFWDHHPELRKHFDFDQAPTRGVLLPARDVDLAMYEGVVCWQCLQKSARHLV